MDRKEEHASLIWAVSLKEEDKASFKTPSYEISVFFKGIITIIKENEITYFPFDLNIFTLCVLVLEIL